MNDNVKNLVKIGKSILRIGVGAGLLYWVCRSIENKNRENEAIYNIIKAKETAMTKDVVTGYVI